MRRPLLERALAIREAAFGPDHLLVAGALAEPRRGAADAPRRRRRDGAAGAGAARFWKRSTAPITPKAIRTLVNLAILYQETGDYTGARERYERARRAGRHRCAGPADLVTLHVLTGVAVVLSDLGGDSAGSARLNERLLTLTERAFGRDRPAPEDSAGEPGHGSARSRRLRRGKAAGRTLARYCRATHSARNTRRLPGACTPWPRSSQGSVTTPRPCGCSSAPHESTSRCCGRANPRLRGRRGSSVTWCRSPATARTTSISSSGCSPHARTQRGLADPRTAESLSNLAALLSTADDYRRTRPLFERALEAQERLLGPDHPEVGSRRRAISPMCCRAPATTTAARRLYERAVSIWERSLGADHPKVATALGNLARFYLRTGSDQERQAAPGSGADDSGEGARSGASRRRASRSAARPSSRLTTAPPAEAFETAARAEALSREHLRLTVRTLPERQALAYASSRPSTLNLMLRLASIRTGRQPDGDRPRGTPSFAPAGSSSTRWRPVIVLPAQTMRGNGGVGHRPGVGAPAPRRGGGPWRSRRFSGPLPPASGRGSSRKGPERTGLAERSARFRDDQSRSRLGLREVSAALPPDSALVAFVRYPAQRLTGRDGQTPHSESEPSYLAFVLRARDSRPVLVPLGSAARIEALILQWRKQLDQEAMAAGTGAARGEAAYRRVAGELRRQVWDPLSTHLRNATRVFVVPDGALHLVSFAALPTAASELSRRDRTHDPLPVRRTGPRAGRRRPADWPRLTGGRRSAFDESSVAVASEAGFRGTRSGCADFQSMRFESLPASLKEVDAGRSALEPGSRQPHQGPVAQPCGAIRRAPADGCRSE